MLRVRDLNFRWSRGKQVLRDISFDLPAGEVLCLLGPNGTGKTTLLTCLLGLRRKCTGTIDYDDRRLSELSARERARVVAYVPQASALAFPYSVREVVLMGCLSRLRPGQAPGRDDERETMRVLALLGITALAEKPYQELSGGEKQLVILARALAQRARVLVMDEPTSALDFANQARTLALIRQLATAGYAILMTTHSPDHALRIADRVLMLKEEALLASGTPQQVITSENLSLLYGVPVAVCEIDTPFSARHRLRVCLPLSDIHGDPGER
jgi:iron complex transport system ATP-binding protein